MINLSSALENWKKWLKLEKNYSDNTLEAYSIDMKSFLDFLASYLEQEITLESVSSSNIMTFRAWLAKRRRNGIKPVSNARALSVVKNFFRYINKHHDIDNQAIFYVEQPNRRRNLPKALSLIDINEVAVAIKSKSGENWLTARDIAIIALLYGCGLRISEALLLKKQDAFSNEILITGKSNKGRVIPMLPIVMEKLSEYVKSCPYLSKNEMDSPLFLAKCGKPLKRTAFANIIRNLRISHNLPEHLTPHAFRHSFATHLLNNQVDIRFIQDMLGHANLSTTEVYAHLYNSSMLKIYKSAHPQLNTKTESND